VPEGFCPAPGRLSSLCRGAHMKCDKFFDRRPGFREQMKWLDSCVIARYMPPDSGTMQIEATRPSCLKAIVRGALGFAMVSLGGFAVWAFGGRWFYRNVGEIGLYLASTIVFLSLAGAFLSPLVNGPHRLVRFHRAFVPAFLAYAVVWSLCWFALKSGPGEWLGSFLGCVVFGWVLGKMLGSTNDLLKVVIVLFVGHSAGYFLGSLFYMSKGIPQVLSGFSRHQMAIIRALMWGLLYGLGFGAGIGFALHKFQQSTAARSE
jgi:hypothetical protein